MTLSGRIGHLATLSLLLLGLLLARLAYWPLVRGRDLQPVVLDPVEAARQYTGGAPPEGPVTLEALPQPVIQRTIAALAGIQRGRILDRNGQVLAYTEATASGVVRRYAEPSLAHVVGYTSGLGTGVTGIEHAFNLALLGLDRFDTRLARLAHQPVVGSDVRLTIDLRLQQAAARLLGGRPGGLVVLEPRTGAVLAMVSAPAFDPNQILDPAYARHLIEACVGVPGCQGALVNRATQGRYTPGSTFKTVTLAGALDAGLVTPETVFDFGEPRQFPDGRQYYVYEVGGGEIIDPNHPERQLDLAASYRASANAAFGRMGNELGDSFVSYAARLGFDNETLPPIEIDASPGHLANDLNAFRANAWLRASTGIGQGEILASPLNLALVVAAMLNDGSVPRPHLLAEVLGPGGDVLAGEPRRNWLPRAVRPQTAQTVREMMVQALPRGFVAGIDRPGLTVGGKTGTAQLGGDQAPHAWFIGFAADEQNSVAIAVMLEHGGSGAEVAAPLFGQVAQAALELLAEPPGAPAP